MRAANLDRNECGGKPRESGKNADQKGLRRELREK
jgi:hypothetical protein